MKYFFMRNGLVKFRSCFDRVVKWLEINYLLERENIKSDRVDRRICIVIDTIVVRLKCDATKREISASVVLIPD